MPDQDEERNNDVKRYASWRGKPLLPKKAHSKPEAKKFSNFFFLILCAAAHDVINRLSVRKEKKTVTLTGTNWH